MKEKEVFKKVIDNNFPNKEEIKYKAKNYTIKRRISAWKKGLLVTSICLVVTLGIFTGLLASFSPIEANNNLSPQNIDDYTELFSVIENFNDQQSSVNVDNFFGGLRSDKATNDMVTESQNSVDSASPTAGGADSETSQTNVQTEGMDEGDLVKVKGQYIYKLNSEGCTIVNANSGEMTILSSIVVDNYVPFELYISEDNSKLIMIGGVYDYEYSDNYLDIEPMYDYYCCINYSKTDIRIYDITDKSAPALDRKLVVEGDYFTSRLETDTNRLYYIVNYHFYYGNEDNYIPKIEDSAENEGEITNIPANRMYYYDDIINYSYLIVGYIDLDEPETNACQAAYLGLSGTIYVSSDNIYVATYDYYGIYERNVFGWVKSADDACAMTRIVKISLDDLEQKALTRVKGQIKDRYSLDEFNGYLRVAATLYTNTTSNAVYVLDSNLELSDKIENIAKGETIYSVRFNGDTGSLVTFERVDPYYRLDLSDPYDIGISDGLKKPGVSYYIHYIEGTDYTIGIGRSTDPDSEWVTWTGIEVILYYNSPDDPLADPVIVTECFIEGNCYAEILYEPKALLYDKEKGILGFAYERWNYGHYYSYSSMEQGFALFGFDTSAEDNEDKLYYRGTLSNLSGEIDMNYNYNFYCNNYWSFISRGLYIGDYIYTISDRYITSYDMATLTEIDQIAILND